MTYSKARLVRTLKEQLSSDTQKARRALLLIYSKQTVREKVSQKTMEYNYEGFTTIDAEILTQFASFYEKCGFLTPNQDRVLRRLIPKYAGQIINSCIERGLIRQISARRYEICKNNR